jgi:ribose transport system substrate-binding protein
MPVLEVRHVSKNFGAIRALTDVSFQVDRVAPYKEKIASKALALVVADTLPVQIDQMKEGLSLGQVGQRPFEMGYKTMMALKDMKDGKAPPADPTYTGLDVYTPETADACIAK